MTSANLARGNHTQGRWSSVKEWSIAGVHLAVLHGTDTTTRVLTLPGENAPPQFHPQHRKCYVWKWRSDSTINLSPSDTLDVTPEGLGNMLCSGHSALADGRLFVAGGFMYPITIGNLHANIFNPAALTWAPATDLSASRFYPSNVTLPDGRVMTLSGSTFGHVLAFGGTNGLSLKNDLQLNVGLDSLLIPNPATATLSGTAPPARRYHSTVFDPERGEGTGTSTRGTFPPGYSYLQRAILFGGEGSSGVFNDVWAFRRCEVNNTWSAIQLSPTGGQPAPRRRHAADVVFSPDPPNRMLVYGGLDSEGQALADCWSLGLDVNTALVDSCVFSGSAIGAWQKLVDGGPRGRAGHTVTVIPGASGPRMVVIGGRLDSLSGAYSDTVWALDLPEGGAPAWSVLAVGGPQREGHVACYADSLYAILVFGGRSPSGLHNDLWALRIADWTWVQLSPSSAPSGNPAPRYLHAGVFDPYFKRLIIVGGAVTTGPGGAQSDVWSLPWSLQEPILEQPGSWRRDFATLPTGARWGHSVFLDPRFDNVARVPEVYSPLTNTWQSIPSLERYLPFYPYLYVLPNNKLFHGGPDSLTRLLNLSDMTWGTTYESDEQAGSSVLYRPWKVLRCGGLSLYATFGGNNKSEKIDLSSAAPAWTTAGDPWTDGERTEHNLTLLPDGNVLMSGGLGGPSRVPRRQPWIWRADSTWQGPLAADSTTRDYHSAAILLPDGRVLSAGGNAGNQIFSANLFEPPYLFNTQHTYAKRPPITHSPSNIYYGQTFSVGTDSSSTIGKVTLIRPGAVTHTFNQDQRFVDLGFTLNGAQYLTVTAPADSFYAPPGNYLLFLVNQTGVPAIAKWVRLQRPEKGGGCPTVDVLTAGGWTEENTILGRSESGTLLHDLYRLKSAPLTEGGRYRIRIRENGSDWTTIDELGIGVVDHARGVRALPMGDCVVLGTREAAYRVTTQYGTDITELVNGRRSSHFVGEPGETLLVLMSPPASPAMVDLDPLEIDPGDKGGGGGNPFRTAPVTSAEPVNVDALTLETTGILLQGQVASGEWTTVRRSYPRKHFDECLIDTLDQGPARLAFVGRHSLRYVGRVNPVGVVSPGRLRLLSARHSRLGDVKAAVEAAGGATTLVGPGDTLTLEVEAPRVEGDQERAVFVVARGVTTATSPLRQRRSQEGPPALQFALEPNAPNPFAGRTRIGFVLPERSAVEVSIYDPQGRQVRQLKGEWPAGRHGLEWDRRDHRGRLLGPGVYLYEIAAGSHWARRKMVVLP